MVTITFQSGVKIKEMRTKYTCISDDNPAKNKVQRLILIPWIYRQIREPPIIEQ